MVDPLLQARKKAMDLLARREHTLKELTMKLADKGFALEVIDEALQKLREEGLQSDERFTEAFVNMRSKKGYGPLRILNELQERGIDKLLQQEHVHIGDRQWSELITAVREKKFGSQLPKDHETYAKQARYLQYRGFTTEQIRRTLDKE